MATKAKANPGTESTEQPAAVDVVVTAEIVPTARLALAEEALAALTACDTEAQLLGVARTFADRARRLA